MAKIVVRQFGLALCGVMRQSKPQGGANAGCCTVCKARLPIVTLCNRKLPRPFGSRLVARLLGTVWDLNWKAFRMCFHRRAHQIADWKPLADRLHQEPDSGSWKSSTGGS